MAEIAAFLFIVALARGTHACLENPTGSMIFQFLSEHFAPFLGMLFTSIADRCHYSSEAMGQRLLKPYKFQASGRWIHMVNGRCQCSPKVHQQLMQVDNKGRTSGTPLLKASQAYPMALGVALVSAWRTAGPVPEHWVPESAVPRRCSPTRKGAKSHPSSVAVPGLSWCPGVAKPSDSTATASMEVPSPGPWPEDEDALVPESISSGGDAGHGMNDASTAAAPCLGTCTTQGGSIVASGLSQRPGVEEALSPGPWPEDEPTLMMSHTALDARQAAVRSGNNGASCSSTNKDSAPWPDSEGD
jgi:hypothetical protein